MHDWRGKLTYYIIKASLLYSYEDFLNFCKDESGNNNLVIKNRIPEFIELIDKVINLKDFYSTVGKFKNNDIKTDSFISETLRMTCLQL